MKLPWYEFVLPVAAVLFLVGLFLIGCAGTERPACSPEALANIEEDYLAEAISACAPGLGYETCDALPAIRAKYAAKREEWIRCR